MDKIGKEEMHFIIERRTMDNHGLCSAHNQEKKIMLGKV